MQSKIGRESDDELLVRDFFDGGETVYFKVFDPNTVLNRTRSNRNV
jgi:hypothetical protein